MIKRKTSENKTVEKLEEKSSEEKRPETLKIETDRDIAMDFASKTYEKFNKIIKSIILFGSSSKQTANQDSDVDIIIIIDDVSVKWDPELIIWYREELGKIIKANPYKKTLHINTTKLSTWWQDLVKGDPIILNIIRYGSPLIDFGGFFSPLKVLLEEGKIKPTPEAVYTLLQRCPQHIARARLSLLNAIDSLHWAMVDSAHAALITVKAMPPSPEHIPEILKEKFVDTKMLKSKYVDYYRDLHSLSKEIIHGKLVELSGKDIDEWTAKTDEFVEVMAKLIDELIKKV